MDRFLYDRDLRHVRVHTSAAQGKCKLNLSATFFFSIKEPLLTVRYLKERLQFCKVRFLDFHLFPQSESAIAAGFFGRFFFFFLHFLKINNCYIP